MLSYSDYEGMVAVDLGNCFFSVGVVQDGRLLRVSDGFGRTKIPATIHFGPSNVVVGTSSFFDQNCVFGIKYLLGRRFEDVSKFVQAVPYEIIDRKNKPVVKISTKGVDTYHTPEKLMIILLRHILQLAETFMKKKPLGFLFGCAGLNEQGSQHLKDCAAICGAGTILLVNEHKGAVRSFFNQRKYGGSEERVVLLLEFGACFFSMSLFRVEMDVFEVLEVYNTPEIGGNLITANCCKFVCEEYKKRELFDISTTPELYHRVLTCCDEMKINLSKNKRHTISISNFHDKIPTFTFQLSSTQFSNSIISPRTIISFIQNNLKYDKTKIDEIVLTGGSFNIPKLRSAVYDYFQKKEPKVAYNEGMIIEGMFLSYQPPTSMYTIDVIPLSLGITDELHKGSLIQILLGRNSTIPRRQQIIIPNCHLVEGKVSLFLIEGMRKIFLQDKATQIIRGNVILDLTKVLDEQDGFVDIGVLLDISLDGTIRMIAKEIRSGLEMERTISGTRNTTRKFDSFWIDEIMHDFEKMEKSDEKMIEKLKARRTLKIYKTIVRSMLKKRKASQEEKDLRKKMKEVEELFKMKDILNLKSSEIQEMTRSLEQVVDECGDMKEMTVSKVVRLEVYTPKEDIKFKDHCSDDELDFD